MGLRMKGGEVGVDSELRPRHPRRRRPPRASPIRAVRLRSQKHRGCWLPTAMRIATGGDEALVVQGDTPIEPLRVGIGTDEQEHVPCVARRLSPLSRQVMSMLSSVPSAVPDNPVTAVRTRKSILGVALILSIR